MTAGAGRLERWRSLAGLLWAAGRWRTAGLAVLVLAAGVLPSVVMLATGALVRAIPGAMRHGLGAPGGEPAVRAGAALVLALAALSVARHALAQLARVLDAAFAREVHHAVARVTLGSPSMAPLEDPALADELEAVRDADRRDVLRQGVTALASVATARLRGAGAFVLLLGFRWWAPLPLALAWHLTHRLYLRTIENGVSVGMSGGAVRLRRAEYLRSLAMDAPAAKEVRVFSLGGWLVDRYAEAWLQALGEIWRSRRAGRGLSVAAVVALGASHAAVLGALGAAALNGQVGVAALLVFAQAVIATHDLGIVGDWQWFLAQAVAVAGRVSRLQARVPGALPPAERAAPARRGRTAVRLEGVRFTYPGRERPTLDGLSLDVPAGQSLAIVGENGAGKSTLIKLLCGLYEPDAGRVTLDGGATPLDARGRIGVIFQEFVRYPLPLRENVGFGHLPLLGDQAALDGAMRGAGAAGVLTRLPAGWDTVLSREFDGGADLSGGQWQRVALARALAAVRGGAGLLILDEPTAALDVKGETELFERFLELTRDVTTILVSHRLSSVRRADRIVVIEGGRVVEDGTHEQLMRRGGRYAAMFTLQAERFGPGAAEGEVAHV